MVALGLPRSAQRLVVVPAGGILVAHQHLYHRGTAAADGAKFRPVRAARGLKRMRVLPRGGRSCRRRAGCC